jgi:hypothetical protein
MRYKYKNPIKTKKVITIRGARIANSLRGGRGDGSDAEPERHTKVRIDTMKITIDLQESD